MTKIAPREQKSHTLDNIVKHLPGRLATAFWQAGRDSIQGLHLALQEHHAQDRTSEEGGVHQSLAGIVQLGGITKVCWSWLAMSAYVSVGYTPQTTDICVCCQHVMNVGPARRCHYLMPANFAAVGVVSVIFIHNTLSYMHVGISKIMRG